MPPRALRFACFAAMALAPAWAAHALDAGTPVPVAASPDPAAIDVPVLLAPREGLFVAQGQPGADDWRALAARGIATVIDLRADGELEGRDEAAEVAAAGLAYRQVPVAGLAGITTDNASLLWQAIRDAEGPVLVHCASGNRVGALLALGAANEGGIAPDQALAFGRSAGLTHPKVDAIVRERLGLPPAGE